MSVPDEVRAATGTWQGVNRLYLPEEPTREVESSALVTLTAQTQFCTMNYTWSFDGQPQDGLLLIGQASDQDTTTVAWVDSWHMGDKIMLCQGQAEPGNPIDVRGSYHVENNPDWGWRITIAPSAESLEIVMYNLSPEGEEFLAVEAVYARATSEQTTVEYK